MSSENHMPLANHHLTNYAKNCRYSHKNQLFWVLIFLLSHKFVILLPPKKIWSYSRKWACSATLKIAVFFIFAIVIIRFCCKIFFTVQALSPCSGLNMDWCLTRQNFTARLVQILRLVLFVLWGIIGKLLRHLWFPHTLRRHRNRNSEQIRCPCVF